MGFVSDVQSKKAVTYEQIKNVQRNMNRSSDVFKAFSDIYVNNSKVNSECKDGKDDGKISFKEKAGAFFSGAGKKLKGQVTGVINAVKSNPVKTLGITAGVVGLTVGATLLFGPAALAVAGAAGLGCAVINGAKSVKNGIEAFKEVQSATTDAQAREAIEKIGGSTVEVAENVALGYMSAAQIASARAALTTVKETGLVVSECDNTVSAAANSSSNASTVLNSTDDAIKSAAVSTDDGIKSAAASTDDGLKSAAKLEQNVESAANNLGNTTNATSNTAKSTAKNFSDAAKSAQNSYDEALKKAVELEKQLFENPYDVKTYRKLQRLVHPDSWENLVDKGYISNEQMVKLQEYAKRAGMIHRPARRSAAS